MHQRGRWAYWLIGLAAVLVNVPAAATESSREPVQLHNVLVSPRRIPGLSLDPSEFPGHVTVITAEDLKRSGATTVQEAIARAEGVTWMDQQGFGIGSDGTLNLRGIVNSSRTNALVLIDGIRQNRITGDEVHWQSISVADIERIEVLRGGSGTIYGEGALAGVINIMTKRGGDRLLETEQTAELGSFGWQRYSTGIRGRAQAMTYGVNYTRQLLDGYRESSWSRGTTVNTHAGWEPSDLLSANVNVIHSDDTTAFPGTLTLAQTEQRRVQPNAFHGFNTNEMDQVSLDVVAGPWAGLSSLFTMFWRNREQASQDSIQFNAFTDTPSRGLAFRTSAEWAGDTAHNVMISGFELSRDKATTGDRDAFPGPDSESNRHGYGLYAEDTLRLWDRVSLVCGLRFDKARYEEDLTFPTFEGTLRFQGFSPKAGIILTLLPEMLDAFASYSRPFKAPNVDDFAARSPSFLGNANLKPQQADTYEVGTRLTRAPVDASATWFYTRINDEILTNGITNQNENFDTKRQGIELSAHFDRPERGFKSYLTYTFVNAEFREGTFVDRTIPGTPAHILNAGIGVSPIRNGWIFLDWRLVQDFFRINDMNNSLGGADNYGVLNLMLEYVITEPQPSRWAPGVRAYLKVENITNEEYVTFASSNGRNLQGAGEAPMPPTSVTGGVTISF